MDGDGRRFTAARHRVGLVQKREVPLAADERRRGRRDGRTRARRSPTGAAETQAIEDLRRARTRRRVAPEQVPTERAEVLRCPRRQPGLLVLLLSHHGGRGSCKRKGSEQRLVKHHAHAVPVARRRHRPRRRLLRRHVGGRPDRLAGLGHLAFQAADQPEVEEDHPTRGRDKHVARLDVAMEHPHIVNGGDPLDELGKRAAEPIHGGRIRSRRQRRFAARGALDRRSRVPDGRFNRIRCGQREIVGRPLPLRRRDPVCVAQEVHPRDEFHGEEPLAVFGEHLVQGDQIGM
jgi:hypothetical protein